MKKLTLIAMVLSVIIACTEKKVNYSLVEKTFIENDSLIDVDATFYEILSDDTEFKDWTDSINSIIFSSIINQTDTIKKYSKLDREHLPDDFPPYILCVSDTICFKSPYLLSILSTNYTFLGGAHGITSFKSYNYDLVNKKEITKESLFNLEYKNDINLLLEKYMQNPNNCFSEKPTVNDAVVNFMDGFIAFTYEQYILGAYACGTLTIKVPINEIKPYMINLPNMSYNNSIEVKEENSQI